MAAQSPGSLAPDRARTHGAWRRPVPTCKSFEEFAANRIWTRGPALGSQQDPLGCRERGGVDVISAGVAADVSPSEQSRDEAELVVRLRAHDESAIRYVYRRYSDGIYRFALYQTADPMLAEDVVGEVFARMMESIGTYSYRGTPISAWLYRIARNLIVDQQRRRGRLRPLEDADPGRLVSANPIEAAESELRWQELADLLAALTEEQRQVILLKFVESLDNREVAAIIGRSEGSVKSLQHRALRSLKRLLERRAERGD
jgi:RNA polymerase sigma-70 factor, ECF subfamily